MNRTRLIRRIRRLAAALTGLAVAWLGLAVAAPAAFAEQFAPGGGGPAGPAAVSTATRTVVVGGMPGWQIALIAAAAALLAAGLALLVDRARAARRTTVPTVA